MPEAEVGHGSRDKTVRGRDRLTGNSGTTTAGGGAGSRDHIGLGSRHLCVSGASVSGASRESVTTNRGLVPSSYKPRSLAMMTFMISLDPP
jgi:hypothetical protein